jgi:type IV secretory pathway protease TraF
VFQGLINSAKTAVSSLILKYIAHASVAVPFGIALAFALAAIAAMLSTVSATSRPIGLWRAGSPPSAQSRLSLCRPGNKK